MNQEGKNLAQLREKDKKNLDLRENETLNVARISEFLSKNGINLNNFDDKFDFVSAMNLTSEEQTDAGKDLHEKIKKGKEIAVRLGKSGVNVINILSERDGKVWDRAMQNFKEQKKIEENDLKELHLAHECYLLVRELAHKSLKVKDVHVIERSKVKPGLTDWVEGKFKEAYAQFEKWPPEKQFATVGALCVGLYMLWTSKNEEVKEFFWGTVKVGGSLYLANSLFQLFNKGKGIGKTIEEKFSSSVGSQTFWNETFKGTGNAEAISKSMVYMKGEDFKKVANAYKAAKASRKGVMNGFGGGKMTGKEVYDACAAFFGKYNVDELLSKYGNLKPPAKWEEIVAGKIVEDSGVLVQSSLPGEVYEGARGYFLKAVEWMKGTAAFLAVEKKYYDWFGIKPDASQLAEFAKKHGHYVNKENEFLGYVKNNIKEFGEVDMKAIETVYGSNVKANGLRERVEGDFVYLIKDNVVASGLNKEEFVLNAVGQNVSEVNDFMMKHYSFNNAGDVAKAKQNEFSIFIAETNTVRTVTKIKKN